MPQLIGHSLALTRIGGLSDPSNTYHYDFLLNSSTAITAATKRGPNLTKTIASNAMSHDSSGNLAYAPHQMLENANWGARTGDLPSGWTWPVETGAVSWTDIGTYSQGVFTGTTQRQILRNTVVVLASETYTLVGYITESAITAGNEIILDAVSTSGTDGDITHADWVALGGVAGWYAVGFTMGAADTLVSINVGLGISGNATGSVTISRPGIVKGLLPGVGVNVPAKVDEPLGRWIGTDDGDEPLYDQPRFAHDPADSNAKLGLLMEEARTNLQIQSETFNNIAWNKTRSVINADATTAPDGNTSADRLIDDEVTGINTVHVNDNVIVATSTVYTVSIFMKADQLSFGYIQLVNFTTPVTSEVYFNLSTGAVGTTDAGFDSVGIIDVGNGWYRCWGSFTTDGADTTGAIQYGVADGDNDAVVDRDGTSSIFIWGVQIELGTPLTSYIPTTTASVTRATDVPPTTTDVSGVNASNISIFAQAVIPTVSAQERSLFTIDDGGTTDVIRLYMDAAENVNFETVNSGDTDGASDGAATIAANTVFKAMGTAEDDSVIGYVDGTGSTEDTSAGIPVTDAATTIRIGGNSGSTVLNGYMQTAKMWNVTKPAAFAEAETT